MPLRYMKRAPRRYKKRVYKTKRTRKPKVLTANSIKSFVRKAIIKKTETKHVDKDWGQFNLAHQSFVAGTFTKSLLTTTTLPAQGQTEYTRDGNKIFLKGIGLRCMFYSNSERPNTKFRVICVKHRRGYNPAASYTSLFDNVSGNMMLDSVDTDKCKVVFDKIIQNNKVVSNTFTDEITTFRKFYIPINKNMRFESDSSVEYSAPLHNYQFFIFGYDTYGTFQEVAVGGCQVWQRTYFKDV